MKTRAGWRLAIPLRPLAESALGGTFNLQVRSFKTISCHLCVLHFFCICEILSSLIHLYLQISACSLGWKLLKKCKVLPLKKTRTRRKIKHAANYEGKLQVLMCKHRQGAGPKSNAAGAFPQHCKLQAVQEQPNETSHWGAWAGVAGIASTDTMGIQDEQCKLEPGAHCHHLSSGKTSPGRYACVLFWILSLGQTPKFSQICCLGIGEFSTVPETLALGALNLSKFLSLSWLMRKRPFSNKLLGQFTCGQPLQLIHASLIDLFLNQSVTLANSFLQRTAVGNCSLFVCLFVVFVLFAFSHGRYSDLCPRLCVNRAALSLNNPHCQPSVTIPWHISPTWKQRGSRANRC